MQIGIGLPNSIPDTPGHVLVELARRAQARGFSTPATIDRIASRSRPLRSGASMPTIAA
jgi:hypothetical protein